MKYLKKSCFILFYLKLFIVLFLFSCTTNQNNDNDNVVETSTNNKSEKALDKAKIIFYSLPSPVEMTLVLQSANTEYNEEFLNPLIKIDDYSTNKSLALNLGVYSADLSYCTLFNQQQTMIKYMSATKKIAENLGITDAINDSTMIKLRANYNNKKAILDIISETFLNSNAYLEENDRAEIAALIMAGGWIESLYIGIQLSEKNVKKNPELTTVIIDQLIAIEDLVGLLELYKNNKNIASILPNIIELKTIYFDINEKNRESSYLKICNKIEKIRSNYTQ